MKHAAIIGAGIAGLACARRLQAGGWRVRLFEKSRGVGGRLATRRVETPAGRLQFDHGAQYFTARDGEFRTAIAPIAPYLAEWPAQLSVREAGSSQPVGTETRYVGLGGMNAVGKALAEGLEVRLMQQVTGIDRTGPRWSLNLAEGSAPAPFDAVIVATPAEQAVRLVEGHSRPFAAEALAARTAPCWAGLFAFAAPTDGAPPALQLRDHPVLAWIACDSAKPGRAPAPACWVAHARADWSAQNLERTPEEIGALLQEALGSVLVQKSAPVFRQAHRWRYARVETAASSPFAWDPGMQLGMCGDWRIGARVEDAWRSGHRLAEAILA